MKIMSFNAVLIVLLTVVGLTAIGCQDQNPGGGDLSGPARLEIVGGDTIDWGEVGGGKLQHQLKLVNVGGDSLHIMEVKPSCGCTTTKIDKEVLKPGDTATVGVTMDVAGRKGEYIKHVNIMSSDTTTGGMRQVTLRAFVEQEIEADPGYFAVVNVKPGERGSASMTFRNVSDHAVTIQPPKAAAATLVDVSFDMKKPVTLQPGDSLRVTASAVTLNAAPAPAEFIFETDSKKTPEITARLTVHTVSDVTIDASAGAPPVGMPGSGN